MMLSIKSMIKSKLSVGSTTSTTLMKLTNWMMKLSTWEDLSTDSSEPFLFPNGPWLSGTWSSHKSMDTTPMKSSKTIYWNSTSLKPNTTVSSLETISTKMLPTTCFQLWMPMISKNSNSWKSWADWNNWKEKYLLFSILSKVDQNLLSQTQQLLEA